MTEPNPTARVKRRAPLWMRVALTLSLVVNMMVAGVVIGGITGRLRHPPPPLGEVNLGAFTPALADEDRKAIRERAAAEGLSMREAMRTARAEQAAIIAALRAEPWDREAVVGLMAQIRSRAATRLDLGGRLVLERLDAMSPGERKALADRMEAAAARHDRMKRN